MPEFKITYVRDQAHEVVQADRVSVRESNGQIVFHREVMVMNRPREIVVRRLAGRDIVSVEERPSSR